MDVAELKRQVEYKFAPEPLLAVQALANTFAFEPAEERLRDPQAAREWLLASGLAIDDVHVGESEWRRLLGFRAAIRNLIDANLEGDHAPGRRGALIAGRDAPGGTRGRRARHARRRPGAGRDRSTR